jgi:DNA-binding CsgD family transcriptional regulator
LILRLRTGLPTLTSLGPWPSRRRLPSGTVLTVSLVRFVHLVSALAWPTAAALGSWKARGLRRRRARARVYLLMALGFAVGAENLAEALSPVHPATVSHLVAEGLLAAVGVVALYLIASYIGELVMEERVVDALSGPRHPVDDTPSRPTRALSVREMEVLECVCRGLGTEAIAREMGISPHTAATHIRNLMRKLPVRSRAEAVGWAVRTGIYDPAKGRIRSVDLDLLAHR